MRIRAAAVERLRNSGFGGFPGYCGTLLELSTVLCEAIPLEPWRAQEIRMERVVGRHGRLERRESGMRSKTIAARWERS